MLIFLGCGHTMHHMDLESCNRILPFPKSQNADLADRINFDIKHTKPDSLLLVTDVEAF
jgi:hypothetical protein